MSSRPSIHFLKNRSKHTGVIPSYPQLHSDDDFGISFFRLADLGWELDFSKTMEENLLRLLPVNGFIIAHLSVPTLKMQQIALFGQRSDKEHLYSTNAIWFRMIESNIDIHPDIMIRMDLHKL